MDPGVSPFYPGPKESAKASTRPDAARGPSAVETAAGGDRAGSDPANAASDAMIRPEDVERQLLIAMRTDAKGETAKAVTSLDRILAIQPQNRAALLGRARIAMRQSESEPAAAERAAALEKAGTLIRTLRRAFEKPTKQEIELFARILLAEAANYNTLGQYDRATTVLREAYDGGIDAFDRIDFDETTKQLRATPKYQEMRKSIDAANLAEARAKVKDRIDKPLGFAFDFRVKDLEGKPLSLEQFKGKVVLVDIWGTWCKPCREALPGLVELYRRFHRHGLEIVGLAYEPDAPSPEAALNQVKQFVQQSGLPYYCGMGDEGILKKIPEFHGFPTTLVIDRSGKVRMLATENSEGLIKAIEAVVQVLLAEPASPATPNPAASQEPAKPKEPPAPAKPAGTVQAEVIDPPGGRCPIRMPRSRSR